MSRLRFGIFMAPFHATVGQNPTTAFQRDIETVQLLDRLGYDEAWIGEHHSCGAELIASPEIFIAHVAAKTDNIKLGTGVLSLPYHNPLWVADRALLLDHLTRGRFMLGLGPGALPTDAAMIGIDPSEQRPALEEDVDVLMQLLTTDEPVTHKTARYKLVDARCQLRSVHRPVLRDRRGRDRLAVRSADRRQARAVAALDRRDAGRRPRPAGACTGTSSRSAAARVRQAPPTARGWRLVGPMHIAETKEQALRDVEYGIDDWFDYLQKTAAAPQFHPLGDTLEERIAWVNESGRRA